MRHIRRDPEDGEFPPVVIDDSAGSTVFRVEISAGRGTTSQPRRNFGTIAEYETVDVVLTVVADGLSFGMVRDHRAGLVLLGHRPRSLSRFRRKNFREIGPHRIICTSVPVRHLANDLEMLQDFAVRYGKAPAITAAEAIRAAFPGPDIHRAAAASIRAAMVLNTPQAQQIMQPILAEIAAVPGAPLLSCQQAVREIRGIHAAWMGVGPEPPAVLSMP